MSDYYESVIINRERYHRAFALPTVLITSAVMMIILLVALTSVSSISISLDGQYYNKLAREAGESGIMMAKACITEIGSPTWSSTSPLHPNTDCGGGPACTGGDQCYVLSDGNVKTTFTVGTPAVGPDGSHLITASAVTQLLRTSNGEVWKTYRESVSVKVKIGWKQLPITHEEHMCSISKNSKAYCWGYGGSGRLGNGTLASSMDPRAVSTGAMPVDNVLQIAVGGFHSCAIASDRKAYCWGYNSTGQIGDSTTTTRYTPVAVSQGAMPSGPVRDIIAGWTRSCAIASDKRAYCWGNALDGRLGNGATSGTYASPVAVSQGAMPADRTVGQLSAADNTTCAIALSNKRAYCWGGGGFGAIGDGTTANRSTPTAVASTLSFRQISTSGSFTCAIALNDTAYCWGDNIGGHLGDGTTTDRLTPVAVTQPAGVTGFRQISTGGNHSCAIALNDKTYCWGLRGDGRLGDGGATSGYSTVPVEVTMPSGVSAFRQVSAGSDGSCGLADNDRTYCWGKLYTGDTPSTTPVVIKTAVDVDYLY